MGKVLIIKGADFSAVAVDLVTPVYGGPSINITSGGSVTISAEGATAIFYTTNGSTPTTSSTQYSSAFTVSSGTTVKAIAQYADGSTSTVRSNTYSSGGGSTPIPIYTLSNKVYDGTNYDKTEYGLFGTSLPNWTLFIYWSNYAMAEGAGLLWNFWGNSNNYICGASCDDGGVRIEDLLGVNNYLSDVNKISDKIAFRRTDDMLYYSLDGVTWVSAFDTSQVTNRRNLTFGARDDGTEFGKGTIVSAVLYDQALDDVSSLFTTN